MAFEGFIEELRARPEDERIAIAGFMAVMVVVALLGVWLLFFFAHTSLSKSQANTSGKQQTATVLNSFLPNPQQEQIATKTLPVGQRAIDISTSTINAAADNFIKLKFNSGD